MVFSNLRFFLFSRHLAMRSARLMAAWVAVTVTTAAGIWKKRPVPSGVRDATMQRACLRACSEKQVDNGQFGCFQMQLETDEIVKGIH